MAVRLAILDLDGTLYRGSEVLPHAVASVKALRNLGLAVRFLTNNSGAHRSHIHEKLLRMGFELEVDEIWTSAIGSALYLQQSGRTRPFVVGEQDLIQTLKEAGLDPNANDADCVVAGICRSLTYAWIDEALQHLRRGVPLVATNTDATYPIEQGRFQPGAGATVGALQGTSQVQPVVIGKPEPFLIQKILEECEVPAEETVVVGDRIETDIESGRRAGCQTWLVLTGVSEAVPDGQAGSEDLRGLVSHLSL